MIKKLKIGIIGGGAAGMMCAVTILESEIKTPFEIHIFDKNPKLGVKVALTGGGRCNVTTGINDMRILLSKYIRGSSFVKPSMLAFPPLKVRQWFEDHEVPLKEEIDGRVFPVSNRGEDIVNVFEKLCQDSRVKLHFEESVLSVAKSKVTKVAKSKILKDKNAEVKSNYTIQSIQADEKKVKSTFDILVITTGGNAYQATGSTGDGYALAKSLGHSVTKLGASLNSFSTEETWCHELAGISLPEARFDIELSSGEKKTVTGPMIFTHFGISGPVVFAMAGQVAFEDILETKPLKVKLIPNSQLNFENCNARILHEINKDGTRPLVNIIMSFVPRRLAETILALTDTKVEVGAVLTKENRFAIVRLLTGEMELNLTTKMAGAEFVTAGGIELEEIERKTMESKLNKNLFFAGEVLNIDAVTGGFNLQSAWATGRTAGSAISKMFS